MNTRWMIAMAVAGMMLAGCITILGESAEETEARRQLDLARTLEAASDLREASHEYSIVAERFPTTACGPAAMRKAGLLYAHPANPARNDSIALFWLSTYLPFSSSPQEKEMLQSGISLLMRTVSLTNDLGHQREMTDSLAETLKKTGTTLTVQGRRILELESQLQESLDELKKLKEVDMKLSRRKRGR